MIGRKTEIASILSVLRAGKHVLLEGPVGAGKTSLAVAVAAMVGKKTIRVDGDGRFTEQKLVGSFDPKLTLELGFTKNAFLPGPLYLAMQTGSVLLINELNRMPEMVQNVLLPALDEGIVQVPYLGELRAQDGFRLIATQNPREFIGTSPLGEALLDRLEWVAISYLSEAEECAIAQAEVPDLNAEWVGLAVALIRMTRDHAKVKRGASIRAAISLLKIFKSSAAQTEDCFFQAARTALANRIELQTSKFSAQSFARSLDELLVELKEDLKKKS